MQVSHQIVELVLTQSFSHRRHHVATPDDGLLDKSIVGREPTGQELLPEKVTQAGTLVGGRWVGAVAGGAIAFEDAPAAQLLGVEAQFGIRSRSRVATASDREHQNQGHEDSLA